MSVCNIALFTLRENSIFSVPHFIVVFGLSGSIIIFHILS